MAIRTNGDPTGRPRSHARRRRPWTRAVVGGAVAVAAATSLTTVWQANADTGAPAATTTVTLSPTADLTASQVRGDDTAATRSTLTTCPTRCEGAPAGQRVAVLSFDLGALPAGAQVVGAHLRASAWQRAAARVAAHPVRGAVTPGTLPVLGGALDTHESVAAGATDWDVADGVQGTGRQVFALVQTTGATRTYWASVENQDAAMRPRLVVTYRRGAGPSPTPTSTASPRPPTPSPSVSPTGPPTPTASPTATATPTATPTPPTGAPELGMYNGNPSENPDQRFIATMGRAPELSSTYITTQAVNETYEKARLARGTSVFLDLDSKNTPGLIGQVAAGSTSGMAYVDAFLGSAERVALSNRSERVYVTYVHEWEVKRAQNVLTNAADRDPATYARALSVFSRRAAAIAPHVLPGLWIGGFPANQPLVAQVMAAMTTTPRWVGTDPYLNSGSATAVATWRPKGVDFFKADPTFRRWGSPPIYLTEFGVHTSLGDAACARFLTDLRGSMRAAGVAGAILFNRDKLEPATGFDARYRIDTGATPQALAAFRAGFGG